MKHVYAVQFGNYDPPEVDSIWDCRECAEKRANDILSGQWRVAEFDVLSTHGHETIEISDQEAGMIVSNHSLQGSPEWIALLERLQDFISYSHVKPGYMGNVNGIGCDPDVP